MGAKKALNFDANASLGLSEELRSELTPYIDSYLNPSSIHSGGQAARTLIEKARAQLAELLGLNDDYRIIFTSGATEANNQAINSSFWQHLGGGITGRSRAGFEIVSSATEHPSVLEPILRLERLGIRTYLVYPGAEQTLQPEQVLKACSPDTKLVSFMLANNETGTISPIAEVCKAVKEFNPRTVFHCDAVQALGKIEVNYSNLNVDMLTFSAHKIGGLTGVGALVVKKELDVNGLLLGGAQELRFRAGTENVLGIVSFGLAARHLISRQAKNIENMLIQRNFLHGYFKEKLGHVGIRFNLSPQSLPNTLSLHVPGILADDLVVALDLEGVLISSGAACASGKPLPSHVLIAMGQSEKEARQTIRISLGPDLLSTEVEFAAGRIVTCINRMMQRGTN